MAIFLPSTPSGFNGSPAEQFLFEKLSVLPDDYFIFHSVRWINPDYDNIDKPQGEADFVIFNAALGLLVLEVKGGLIRYENRQWYQKNRATNLEREIEDPESQANRSKYFILNKIKERLPKGNNCLVCHGVCFPDTIFPKQLSLLNYSMETIIDENDIENIATSILKIFAFWQKTLPQHKLSQIAEKLIVEIIAPVYRVTHTLRAEFENRESKFIRLTTMQCKIIDYLDEQRRACIAGPAGTGKTVIALEKAKVLSSKGQSVTFICYNSALRKYLQCYHRIQNVEFHTFHSFARQFVKSNNLEELPSLFCELLSEDDALTFQNLIIDEGQDFENDWLEWLDLRTAGIFYVFFDPNQLINQKELPSWFAKAECRLIIKQVCRNTKQICNTTMRLLESSKGLVPPDIIGQTTKLFSYSSAKDLKTSIQKLVNKLLVNDKYQPHDLAILNFDRVDLNEWSYLFHNKPYSAADEIITNNICISTIRKFKGLEAKVVIIVGGEFEDAYFNDWRNKMYVGCSRAMHELFIFIPESTSKSLSTVAQKLTGLPRLVASKESFASLIKSEWIKEN